MKRIAALDAAIGKELTFEEPGVGRTFYWAYRHSHEADTEILDFDDVIWERESSRAAGALDSTGSPFPAGCPTWLKPSRNSRSRVAG